MKVGITKFVILAAIAALVVVGSSTALWAQCPASPNYTPDFSSAVPQPNPPCLSLTGNTAPNMTTSNPPASGYPGFYPPASSLVPPVGTPNPALPPPAGVTNVLRLTTNSGGTSGSAWFTTQQLVAGTFSTTFTFQLSGSTTAPTPGDGFAFVIQNSNSSVTALDPGNANGVLDGCSLGFGQSPDCDTTDPVTGIPNSVAVMFDTYQNVGSGDPSNSYVAIQSCGTANNTVDAGPCRWGVKDLTQLLSPITQLPIPITLADGNYHTVAISFTPSGACSAATPPGCPGVLDVILDSIDLFPAVPAMNGNPAIPEGVAFDMASIGLNNGTAWVGFTAATGGADDNQDILSWTFMPGAQSGAINTVTPTVLSFNGGTQNNAYDYNAQLTSGGITSATATINPILMSQKDCDKLVQKSFPLTQCFVYKNAAIVNGQSVDASVLFELTCPDQPGGTCGSPQTPDFFAQLGSDFTFTFQENIGFNLLSSTIGPYPGWLKGTGPDPLHPCTPYPNNWPPLFQSNQIESFSFSNDPSGKTKGGSNDTGSCWGATYATFGELPPGVRITSPKLTTYARNSPVSASYSCTTPVTSKDVTNPSNTTGPYLTVASCSQSQFPNKNNTPASCSSPTFVGGISCTGGGVDTSTPGLHVFTVTGVDTGGNVNVNAVLYNVK